jgi:hypothetical protein
MTNRPILKIQRPSEPTTADPLAQWKSLSWEDRRGMSAAELSKAMGPLWVGHKDFKERPRSLLPVPNLCDRTEVFVPEQDSFLGLLKMVVRLVMR